MIGDRVRQVGGDQVDVNALVRAGADAQIIELTESDIRANGDAELVVINGGESWSVCPFGSSFARGPLSLCDI